MAKFFCAFLLGLVLFFPLPAQAAGMGMGVTVSRQEDGSACGEVWYDNRVLWRVRIVGDGARAAAGTGDGCTTVVAPDVRAGMFVLKVYNE